MKYYTNNINNYKCMFCIILLFLSNIAFAQELSVPKLSQVLQELSQDDIHSLKQGTPLDNISKKRDKERLQYTPSLDLFSSVTSFISDKRPNILYENLFLYKEHDSDMQKRVLAFLNSLLRDVPVLATIEYTNLKDGNIHPIFLSSERIEAPENHTIIAPLAPLVAFPSIERQENIFVKQDMPPFGEVISQYEYYYKKYYGSFLGINITPVKYNDITSVQPNNMYTACWIIQTDEGILIYGIGAVKIYGLANMFGRVIENSFASRMYGLFYWIQQQLSTPNIIPEATIIEQKD